MTLEEVIRHFVAPAPLGAARRLLGSTLLQYAVVRVVVIVVVVVVVGAIGELRQRIEAARLGVPPRARRRRRRALLSGEEAAPLGERVVDEA